MDRIRKTGKLRCLITFFFLLFTGALMCMSIALHCHTDIYDYGHKKSIVRHTPFIYCAIVLFAVCALAVIYAALKRICKDEKRCRNMSRAVFVVCGAVIFLEALFWIFFYESGPINDQRDIWLEARRIAGFLDEPFDTGYFAYYPRNRGTLLLMAGLIRMFGDHLYAFRFANLAAVVLLYICLCRGAEMLYRDPLVNAVTSILLLLFYPIVVYSAYLYGTILSAAFVSLGLCMTLRWQKTGRRRYAVLLAVAFSIAVLAHQSAAVGLLAAVLYLLISGGKKEALRNLSAAFLAVVMLFLATKAVDVTYERITGADPDSSSMPLSCTIYMGITATDGLAGPGSQDGSNAEILNENRQDGKAANRDAMRRIAAVLGEYATGKRDPGFFLEKTQYQWLDPTLGARWTIRMNDPGMGYPPNSESFAKFYDCNARNILFKLSIALMLLIYFGAVVSGITTLRAGGDDAPWMLIQLFVSGGYAFQMIWESFSRYCFSYYLWLIPGAAYGICLCGSFLADKVRVDKIRSHG